jgi:hypothetical protein
MRTVSSDASKYSAVEAQRPLDVKEILFHLPAGKLIVSNLILFETALIADSPAAYGQDRVRPTDGSTPLPDDPLRVAAA